MTGALRLSRGLIVAIVVVAVSASLHALGGGCLSHVTTAAFLLVVCSTAAATILLSSREWTPARLAVIVGIAQLCFHAVFEFAPHASESGGLIPSSAVPTHTHPPVMVLAHVAAAAVVIVILRRGERWLLTFLTMVAGALHVWFDAVATSPHVIPCASPQAPKESGLRRILFASLLTHRGPPRFLVPSTAL